MAGRRNGALPAMVAIVGLIGLVHVIQLPRFAAYRAVDVVQLVGSGLCFGVALVGFIALFRGKPPMAP